MHSTSPLQPMSQTAGLAYGEGDRVRHIKFGEGTVVGIVNNGGDYEVTVNFDRAGVKKCAQALQSKKV